MGELMNDALGVGLAATQVGVLHRVLVYRVQQQAPVAALVNPEIEWSGSEEEIAGGGLPQPAGGPRRGRAPGPRPGPRAGRVRRADPDRGLGARGARDPARDRPPRRRPDPRPHVARAAQGGDAGRCARPQAAARPADSDRRADRLPRHLGVRRRGAARASPTRRTARRSSSPARTGRAAAAASWPRRRWPSRPASSGIDARPAGLGQRPEAPRADRRRRARTPCACAPSER